ncbi:MAG TPA: L,D-transpeptidase family protein [Conexibacter sp.]
MSAPLNTTRARTLLIVGAVVLLLTGACAGVLAFSASAANDRIPKGVTIAGVDVGGKSAAQARRLLRQRIGQPANRAVVVTVNGRRYELSARQAGVKVSFQPAIERALASGDEASFITRGWRQLTGTKTDKNEKVAVTLSRKRVAAFVDTVARAANRPPQDAVLSIALDSVTVTRSQDGTRLRDPQRLQRQLIRSFRHPRGERDVRAQLAIVRAAKTTEQVWEANPTVVTVSKTSTTVRVFVRGELTQTYHVAVGSPEYPTPAGQYVVQSMQVDPPWNVPNSAWAGDLAGQTIPGGSPENPLVARWIGFNGSVGFHGTADIGSLGSAASHGCVRMDPDDVIDLYERVSVGTPVLVA